MSIDRIVLAFAGVMIIATVLLGMYHHTYWLWFTVFIGANLLQSAFTGFCPLALILKKAGSKPGAAFN
ncbi:MAG: YgaP family membrane protein [Gammaproteobacteria bacterium]